MAFTPFPQPWASLLRGFCQLSAQSFPWQGHLLWQPPLWRSFSGFSPMASQSLLGHLLRPLCPCCCILLYTLCCRNWPTHSGDTSLYLLVKKHLSSSIMTLKATSRSIISRALFGPSVVRMLYRVKFGASSPNATEGGRAPLRMGS